MSNFQEVTTDWQQREGEERYLRIIDDRCWISVLHRLTGFGYWEWETAIVFVADVPQPTHKDREFLMIRGDWRDELNDMPKEQLRDWYAARIDGNRNSWDTLMQAIENAAESDATTRSGET